MKKNLFLFSLLFLFSCNTLQVYANIGAQQAALGGAGSNIANIWSLWHNPSLLAKLKEANFGIYSHQPYFIGRLNDLSIAGSLPHLNNYCFAMGARYYGNKFYSETNIKLGYAMQLNAKTTIGLNSSFNNIRISNYGNGSSVSFGIGMQLNPHPKLFVSSYFNYPNLANRRFREEGISGPSLVSGFAYIVDTKFLLALDIKASLRNKIAISSGFEYALNDLVLLRLGVATNPSTVAMGLGFKWTKVQMDFGTNWKLQTGFSPHFSIQYLFTKTTASNEN